MSDLSSWWEGLSLALKIYWGLAIPFTFFFLLQLILSFAGGDVPDDTPDVEVEGDVGVPFQFLTLKNLVAFFTIFGWTGIACVDSGMSEPTSVFVAFVAGLLMMTIMASLFYFMAKANENGTMKLQNALGKSGQVYLTIPAKRGGIGKIQITIQKSLRTLDAVTDDEEDVKSGKLITVKDIVNGDMLLVSAK